MEVPRHARISRSNAESGTLLRHGEEGLQRSGDGGPRLVRRAAGPAGPLPQHQRRRARRIAPVGGGGGAAGHRRVQRVFTDAHDHSATEADVQRINRALCARPAPGASGCMRTPRCWRSPSAFRFSGRLVSWDGSARYEADAGGSGLRALHPVLYPSETPIGSAWDD